jgi:hypothetical protein
MRNCIAGIERFVTTNSRPKYIKDESGWVCRSCLEDFIFLNFVFSRTIGKISSSNLHDLKYGCWVRNGIVLRSAPTLYEA